MGRVGGASIAAVAAFAYLGGAGSAEAHRPDCYFGRTFAAWNIHRVYGAPYGCVWLYRPTGGHASIGPQFRFRVHGVEDGDALPRDPIGEALTVCGFSGFLVSWPYFVVTARRVAWGTGPAVTRSVRLLRSSGRRHFVYRAREGRRPPRWTPILDASSPPLRRPASNNA